MPVITRNQNKNVARFTIQQPESLFVEGLKNNFVANIYKLLVLCESTEGKDNKMNIALEIYTNINKILPELIKKTSVSFWLSFAATTFNKTTQFINESKQGDWIDMDKNIVKKFNTEMYKTRNFVINLIKNNWNLSPSNLYVIAAKEEITRMENSRPQRNIPRVNYMGMDSIDPESEFDGITDIWADKTIKNDPNYEFEEDEGDEEEVYTRWTKIHPELSAEEKTELKKHLSQLVDNHRVTRNLARVNYTGMDMSEEDEEKITSTRNKI